MPALREKRKVFKDIIRDAIYDAILSGELQPGERIVEMEWAEKFGSSQAPVREAIRDLEGQGIVETVPFKGAVVTTFDDEKLREIHSIRAGLETAALTRLIREASDEEIHQIGNILDDMLKAAGDNDLASFLDKDIEFHETIVTLSGMKNLKRLWDMCLIRLSTAYSTHNSTLDLYALAENHVSIYKKLEERDSKELFETISGHFMAVTGNNNNV